MATTVQNIVDSVSQDIRKLLGNSGSDATILVDYVNRAHLSIVEHSTWPWMKSPLMGLITRYGVNRYMLSGVGFEGGYGTSHNFTNLDYIDENSVYDRTTKRRLVRVDDKPGLFEFEDAHGYPKMG